MLKPFVRLTPAEQKRRDWDRWCACLHEAGHLVAMIDQGIRPRAAHVAYDAGEAYVQPEDQWRRHTAESCQIVAMAGVSAVAIMADPDHPHALELSDSDWAIFNLDDPQAWQDESLRRERQGEADQLVLRHQAAVLEVAHMLWDKRVVGDDQITKLVRRSPTLRSKAAMFAKPVPDYRTAFRTRPVVAKQSAKPVLQSPTAMPATSREMPTMADWEVALLGAPSDRKALLSSNPGLRPWMTDLASAGLFRKRPGL